MDFVVEELSPVRKKITVNADAAEVSAALDAALRFYRRDLTMPGFRKGKAPASVVERRFGEEMKSRVIDGFLGDEFNAYLQAQDIVPLSRPEVDGATVERGQAFSCTLTFDVMPAFTLPEYSGLEVEQEEAAVPEAEIDEMIERLRGNMATESPVEKPRKPVDGDGVEVDFAGFEDGNAIDDVKGEHFRVVLGEGQVLPDFEAIVRELKPGEEKEGPVTFPENYGHTGLAGKTITMRVKLNSVSTRELPVVDEEFAKKMGQDSVEKLREAIAQSMKSRKEQASKAAAQQKLMDMLIEKVDFPLPEGMVNTRVQRIVGDARIRLTQQHDADTKGKPEKEVAAAKKALDKKIEDLQEEAKKEAEMLSRIHLLLMSIARKENITVSQQEADMQIYQMAMRNNHDFNEMRDFYIRSGMMSELFERIQADKAMDLIYEKAAIKTVAAPEGEARAAKPKKAPAKAKTTKESKDSDESAKDATEAKAAKPKAKKSPAESVGE